MCIEKYLNFELCVKDTDIKFQTFIDLVKTTNNLQKEVEEFEQWRNLILEEINWLAITEDNYFDEDKYNELLHYSIAVVITVILLSIVELLQELNNEISEKK